MYGVEDTSDCSGKTVKMSFINIFYLFLVRISILIGLNGTSMTQRPFCIGKQAIISVYLLLGIFFVWMRR